MATEFHLPEPWQPSPAQMLEASGVMACRGDDFCRCRTCKPPLPPVAAPRSSLRVQVGLAGLAVVLFLVVVYHACNGG